MSKLVEWVVVKHLMQYFNSNNLDNLKQSAYKTAHSTETALRHLKNEIHLSLSCGEPTALVLIDLSAAFDTIERTTLLNCLKSWFGVCGMAWKCFTSYLNANALVSSRPDYCNSLFRSLSSLNMCKLQCIQTILVRILTNCNKHTGISYSQMTPFTPQFPKLQNTKQSSTWLRDTLIILLLTIYYNRIINKVY